MARLPISYPVGQGFAQNPRTYANLGMRGHNGWDFPAPRGATVVAPESGVVTRGTDPSGYGTYVKLKGDSGWEHVLGHLASYGAGGHVSEGTAVGYVNSTGFSTGNHLHWGTRPPGYDGNNGYYGYVDPQRFIDSQGGPKQEERVDGATITDFKREAMRQRIQKITGGVHDDNDLQKNHMNGTLQHADDVFFASQEYVDGVNSLYQGAYGRDATPQEIQEKRSARVSYFVLMQDLIRDLGKDWQKNHKKGA